jgi:hypothetical protein
MNTLIVALTAVTLGAPIPSHEVKLQNETFNNLWNADFVWKFEALPAKGGVPNYRVPYSGYIYPDRSGGTQQVLRKYDRAFNRGRMSASSHEAWDVKAFKEPARGIFGGRALFGRMEVPDWYGHCNGWTSATIRHAEPEKNVTVRGVTFTPADIKALLAEIYIYNDHTVLAGDNRTTVNAGLFHAIMTNWLGRGEHPLGMEEDPTKEKWNYPVYAYATSSAKHSARRVEVKMNIAYALDSDGEFDESPKIKEIKYFHYMVELNSAGNIVGGYFFRDSSIIDMLWVPLRPKKSGQEGNESGNPYVNVDQVLAIWRASVEEELRDKWVTVDPAEPDQVALSIDGEDTTPVSVAPVESSVDGAEAADNAPATESEPADESEPVAEEAASDDVDSEMDAETDVAAEDSDDDPAPALPEDADDVDADSDMDDDQPEDIADEDDGMVEAAAPLPLDAFND